MRKIISVAGLAAAVLAVAACASSASTAGSSATSSAPAAGSSSSSAGTTLKTTTINGTTVLTNSAGFTVYWFAIDTANKSNCTGSCVTYWPPVKGPATAGSGVTGTLSTITRSDGTTQVTYDGHPLYTYVGDSAPGQNKGNGQNLSGGLWYEATPSGTAPATGTSASASPSSGGGYGY
jgi:predicted lipoprotein with Yx(FWY)xxD motif